jgi:hypothetical protein
MNDPQFSENIPGAQPEAEHGTKRKALGTTIVITGFGRQKVYPPVGRCIYCFSSDCDLGDEHIIPQALGGNIILQRACCPACEKIIGAALEHRLMHKTKGMFAALRLRHGYKSKRPKERPKSLPFTIIGKDGSRCSSPAPSSASARAPLSTASEAVGRLCRVARLSRSWAAAEGSRAVGRRRAGSELQRR